MNVTVKLFGLLRKEVGKDMVIVPFSINMNSIDVLNFLKENYSEISFDIKDMVIIINQHISSPDKELQPGDEVNIMPFVGGG